MLLLLSQYHFFAIVSFLWLGTCALIVAYVECASYFFVIQKQNNSLHRVQRRMSSPFEIIKTQKGKSMTTLPIKKKKKKYDHTTLRESKKRLHILKYN